MNYILLILFLLAAYKFTEQKENFKKLKTCRECRIELSKKKRAKGEKVDPIKIFKKCIDQTHCVKNDLCTFCVEKDKSIDSNLVKTIENDDYGNFTVDLNNCKKFRYCRDEFENGICNTDEWNKEGGEKYCCNPCVSEIRKNIDEADENALDIARTCMTNLKLDEKNLWNNEYDIKQGVCSLKTIQTLKDRQRQKRKIKHQRRVKNLKRMSK